MTERDCDVPNRRSSAAIEVSGLCVAYGASQVLSGVDLRVESGGITAIVGGSGCGKSTLLKAIIGLVPASAGRANRNRSAMVAPTYTPRYVR